MDASYWTKRRRLNANVSAHIAYIEEARRLSNIDDQHCEREIETHACMSDEQNSSSSELSSNKIATSGSPIAETEREHSDLIIGDQLHDSADSSEFDGELSDHSDDDSEVEDNSNVDLSASLAAWATTFRITHCALRQLLLILLTFFPHIQLPKDPRTMLKTARRYNIRNIANGLYHHFGIAEGIARTITSENVRALTNESNTINCIHIQVNVDGLPLHKSSKAQFWPILGRVVQPVTSEPFVIGLFSGEKKPGDVGEFLHDFIAEVQFIEQHGMDIDGCDNKPGIHLSCFICDAPARAYIKNIKGHNAYHGCDKCTQNGVWKGKVTFPEIGACLRSDVDFDEMKDENHHLQNTLSPLCNISLGIVSQFPHDPMHLVYLGVVKRLIWSWIKGPVVNKCRIGANNVQRISNCLLSCHRYLPREFPRKCRSLLDMDRWKATEFRQFILYSGAVVVKGKISDLVYQHFLLLVVGIFCLCSPLHCITHCEYSNDVLCMFVEQWGTLYGKDMLVYNVHGLTHLAADAMRFGPLDSFSAFPFENFLGKKKKMLRKPKSPLSQVIRRLSEIQHTSKKDTELKEYSVKGEHMLGPLPFEFRAYSQFTGIKHNNLYFSINDGDNCIKVGSSYGLIRNICKMPNCDQAAPVLMYECFSQHSNFFTEPLNSSDLGIVEVGKLSGKIESIELSEIVCKYVMIPHKKTFVIVPLLHQFV